MSSLGSDYEPRLPLTDRPAATGFTRRRRPYRAASTVPQPAATLAQSPPHMPLPPLYFRLCHLILLDLHCAAQYSLDDQRPGQGVAHRQDRVGPRGHADTRGGVFCPCCESARNMGRQGEEWRGRLGDWRGWQICVQVGPSGVPVRPRPKLTRFRILARFCQWHWSRAKMLQSEDGIKHVSSRAP